jgi:hypothetical protein
MDLYSDPKAGTNPIDHCREKPCRFGKPPLLQELEEFFFFIGKSRSLREQCLVGVPRGLRRENFVKKRDLEQLSQSMLSCRAAQIAEEKAFISYR